MLDEYRRSFGEAHETVVAAIRDQLGLEPTGRPAKSTVSLVEKLHRESIRLVQVQDIAGCRIVVADVGEQERVVASLRGIFPQASVIDRRTAPSYGYRAVHIVAKISGKLVEIQVRTLLQHLWAEVSERLSDVLDPEIKYGGGDELIRKVLRTTSETVAKIENLEMDILKIEQDVSRLPKEEIPGTVTPQLLALRARLADQKREMREQFDRVIAATEKRKGRHRDFPN
jgi:ppGpp synthetase/RelA/SpoT-type nucleotidyltranferase